MMNCLKAVFEKQGGYRLECRPEKLLFTHFLRIVFWGIISIVISESVDYTEVLFIKLSKITKPLWVAFVRSLNIKYHFP